jgi:hypothetical protein
MRVLYEEEKITFDVYLDFFAYLTSYRFRFLTLNPDDLEKAVFGDGIIAMVRPERIRNFNFALTLSEEYGVTFTTAIGVVARFLVRVLADDSVVPEVADKIFIEIFFSFPTKTNKKALGKMLIKVIVDVLNRQNLFIGIRIQEKIDSLSKAAEIFNSKDDLWKPR